MNDIASTVSTVSTVRCVSIVRRLFTPLLVMGTSGAGKTSLLGPFAEYLWERYQRVLLLYSWDGGAIPTGVQKLMQHGIIRFWRVRTRSAQGLGIETAMLASKGYWPTQIDPMTGETSPAVPLVAPVTVRYTVTCRKSSDVLTRLVASYLIAPTYCPSCKDLHPVGDLNVTEDVHRTPGFEQVGGVAFDSLTSAGMLILDHMDEARGAGQIGGEKSAFGGNVTSGSVKFGGSNRADYAFAQQRCRQMVHNSQGIPYLVESPVFTALTLDTTDEGGLPIAGAKLPGRAATDEASAWFGNVVEMGRWNDDAGHEHYALYLRGYTDNQNRRHLLKTSASPDGVPDKLVDPIGQPWTQANLGLVLRMLDDDLTRAMAEKAIPGAPGLAQTPSHYGEGYRQAPAPAPAAEAPVAAVPQPPFPSPLPRPVQAPPAIVPPPPVPAPPSQPAAAAAKPAAPAPPVARRRTRVNTAPLTPAASPPVEPVEPIAAPEPTEPVPPVPPPLLAAPPPPPGMKPPQRAPGT